MVHIYVSQLRKVLPAGALQTRPPGYRLEVAPEAVDLLRFERLRKEGRAALADGDAATAAERLAAACALWRGPALAEFSEPFAAAAAAHLEELRLVAVEDRVDAELALGRHRDVVGELQALVASHPLRERPRRQLMLALYRQGRHAEALAAFQELRAALRDELGIDPSAGLAELQYRILNQDPALDHASPAAGAAAAPRAGPGAPRRAPTTGSSAARRSSARLEHALDEATAGRGATALIAGPAGIGKTRLTGELAERARGRGATVLTGRCIDLVGAALPYFPLVEALRPLRGTPSSTGCQELSRLLPGSPLAADRRPERAASRSCTCSRRCARRSSASAPPRRSCWCSRTCTGPTASTLDLLAFLAHAVRDGRVLIVATWRQRRRCARTIRCTGWPPGCGAAASRSRWSSGRSRGTSSRRSSPARATARCPPSWSSRSAPARRATRSSPRSCSPRRCAARPSSPRCSRTCCSRTSSACTRRPARSSASPPPRGAPCRPRSLTAAMPLGEAEIVEALREAVDHDVLVPDRATGTYRFRHALIAEAAYATLLPGEREDVHERLARALAARRGARGRAGRALDRGAAAGGGAHRVAAGRARGRSRVRACPRRSATSSACSTCGTRCRAPRSWPAWRCPRCSSWAGELAGEGGDARRGPALGVAEARELYPLAVVLESLAIRQSPAFEPAALEAPAGGQRAHARGAARPAAAMPADDDFHARLTAGCGNEPLLAALRPVQRALLRYEHVYMLEPARIERSVAQHDEIIEALERGDHAEAAQRLRHNLTGGLPDLRDALER